MGNPDFSFANNKKRQHKQIRQRLFSWSSHVSSWVNAERINKLIVRYEDMKLNPLETFVKVAGFLQLPNDQTQIEQALLKSDIKNLQKQENEKGFNERSAKAESFFRKGIVGDWQETLTDKQIKQVVTDHAEIMQYFGYIDNQSQPLVEPLEMNSASDNRATTGKE